MTTFFGLLSALVHFCGVEVRPLVLLYPALESGCFSIIKNQYLYRDRLSGADLAKVAHEDCNVVEASQQFDALLVEAMNTLSWDFMKEDRCARVVYVGNNYGAFIYLGLRNLLFVVFSINFLQFGIAATRAIDFSFWSGEYLAFSVHREETKTFTIAVWGWCSLVCIAVYLGAMLVARSAIEEGENCWVALYQYATLNVSSITAFITGVYLLTVPTDATGLMQMNQTFLRRVTFKRSPSYVITYQSNDYFYVKLMIAAIDDARGRPHLLEQLCDGPQSLNNMREAMKGVDQFSSNRFLTE